LTEERKVQAAARRGDHITTIGEADWAVKGVEYERRGVPKKVNIGRRVHMSKNKGYKTLKGRNTISWYGTFRRLGGSFLREPPLARGGKDFRSKVKCKG